MGEDDSGEKTEEPTPHKLREARKKGQIVKSKEITAAILLFVSFFTLKFSATHIWYRITYTLHRIFDFMQLEFTPTLVGHLLLEVLLNMFMALAPLFAAIFMAALMSEAIQTGFLVAGESLKPKLEKLNPLEGAKKFFSLKQYVELVKSLLKMSIVIYLLYNVIRHHFPVLLLSQQMGLWQVMAFTGVMVMDIIVRIGIFYVFVALFDYFYQRYEFMKSMKMSKKEIKDEYKRLEGDPTIKQRQKEAAREMAMGRQMGAVPGADVVVTNPVHIAMAIKYDPAKMKAPTVVAKGKRLVAEAIKSLAEQNGIPIVENAPLARSLYAKLESNMEVLPEFYQAVAEILAFVYNLKKKKRKK